MRECLCQQLVSFPSSTMPASQGQERLTNCRKLPPHMQHHGDRHDECHDVHGARGALEDDGVGQLNVARVAIRLYPHAARDRRYRAYRRAERQRCHAADAGEVPKAHSGERGGGRSGPARWVVLRRGEGRRAAANRWLSRQAGGRRLAVGAGRVAARQRRR